MLSFLGTGIASLMLLQGPVIIFKFCSNNVSQIQVIIQHFSLQNYVVLFVGGKAGLLSGPRSDGETGKINFSLSFSSFTCTSITALD